MDENQDKIVFNESKPFDKQVDDVLSGADTASSHLEVLKVTPPLLRMVGVPNLPILMTARHVKTITQENGSDSANYHGLGVELIKKLPELISDPVMIMDSISPDAKAQNSIVIVTQMVDNKNRPVIGAIKLNGFGRQNSKIISANILTSAYGKDNFQSFIERNIKQGSVLYVDKEKSQALSVNPGIQFPDVMASLSFNTIIRKTNAFVNSDKQKSSEKSKRSPLLINLFAGPSAGKTTAALELTAALKKKGFNVEYVSEYAKELVLENKTELLKNQVHVTDEQFHRLDRLRNSGVEIIVTDSPVLLGKVYGEGKISREYGKKLLTYHNSFDNFNLFVNRGSTFQTEGRVHNLEQSKELDAKILAMLQDNRIFYGNYNHDEIDKTVERITTSFSRLKKLEETTEKNEGSMIADTNNANAQSARERVQQIRDSMVKTLLEHIEKNPTDWQSGWNNIAAGAPYNGKTNTAYRGLNALYLAFLGAERGYKDTRWVTFNQAKELGASVKKGEKSTPVIFFEFYDRKTKKAFDNRTVKDMTEEEKTAYLKENVYAVMKYSSVFNAEQCHNFPERKEIAMSEEEMANQNAKIETIIANSGAPIRYDGGSRAYYSPGTDSIHLPAIPAFDTMQDYYATALHEIAHSTGHESRLNRDLAGSFGSESYAKEELRAELACVFMQMEQGIQLNGKHITNHAAYLNSWLQAAKNDTSVFFKAAADAQRIADYVADNYLQAAAGAVIEEKNVAQEQTEEQPERNPMADYLRAAQLDSAVSDAGERSWEQENIRDWYTSAYPNDEAGLDIHPNATFKDLRDEVNRPNPISVYGMLGEDSVVRERAFTRLAELSGSSYASIYSAFLGETAAQKLENARALAKRLAIETGEPYVTIEWSEHQALNSYDVMSLSEADKKLAALDAQEDKNEGYYKTKLHIDYVFEGEHDAYECCRFDIGSEGGGLVHHIDEFLKYDTFLGAEERQQAENALKYFKVHMDLSAMVDTTIASNLPLQKQFDVQSYVLAARGAVNSAVPFSTYKLPETSAFEQEEDTVAHRFLNETKYGSPVSGIIETKSGNHIAIINNNEQKEVDFPDGYPSGYLIAHDYNPDTGEFSTAAYGFVSHEEAREYLFEQSGVDIGQSQEEGDHREKISHFSIKFSLNYSNEMLLNNELKTLGYERDKSLYEINERNDIVAVEKREGRWVNGIRYLGAEGKSFQGFYGRTYNGIMLEATNITGFTTTGLSFEEVSAIADIIRDFEVDVNVKEIPTSINNQTVVHKEKITLEEARNAMLDAQEQRQNHYAVRIEDVPYTDPEDGYEGTEPAQVIYIISEHGNVREWKTIPLDSDVFSSDLPNGSLVSYEPVEYEELEEIAERVKEPIQKFKDVLRKEVEADAKGRRSDAYYDQRVDDILDEHYRTEHGLFKRDIENPKYLSGTLYAEETFRGERVVSLTKDESGKNIAIIARVGGGFAVAEDYRPEDGRRWGKAHYFDDQKSAEEFRAKNFPSVAERANQYQALAASKSPLGQEYARIKGENADSVVFYRVGDFFEVLGADAERVAEKLELTLTGRTIGTEERVPMCGVPYHAIDQYADTLAKKGENVIVADGTDIRERKAKIDLTEKRLREYADTLRRNDLEVGNTSQTDEYYLSQAREQIAAYERSDEYQQALREDFPNDFIDDIDDTPQDMAQIPQNQQNTFCTDFGGEYTYFIANEGLSIDDICTAYAERPYDGFGYQFGTTITAKQYKEIQSAGKGFNIDFLDDINAFTITQDGKVIDSGYLYEDLVLKYQERQNKPAEAQERKREWLSIELPTGAVGGQYGENTMIKMPKGEFSYYAFYVPTRFLKEADGKTQLRVASDYTFRLNNDGRQVELTGQELKDSFAGKHLDKTYKRVAPSRRYAQGLANLEKNIPAELKAIPTWCCYRTQWNEEKGKKDKFIISPIDGKWTSTKEPGKWVTFEAAMKYARENNCEGVSLLLDKKYGITCIDLDKCILNAETGEMKQRATKLVEALSGTYIERSTSGNGLHIFVKDDILKNGTYNSQSMVRDEDPRGDLEVFDDKRIMSLTGDMYSKGNTLTRACSAATVYLRQELGERRRIASNGTKPQPTASQSLSDNELIRWIRGSKQGAKFDDLYSGRGVSGDRSNDDGKLAHLLLYFNGGDKEQAFRIMRESGAYRPDKPDSYYRHTIDKMNDKIEVYAKRPTFSADGHGKPKGKGPGNGKKGSQA